jgi:hypothetical protein
MPEWPECDKTSWAIRVINLSEMEIVHDEALTDKELVDKLLDEYDRSSSSEMLPRDGKIGLSFSIKVDRIVDRDMLVKYFWTNLVQDMEGYTSQWELENIEPAHSRRYDAGHPDYILKYNGSHSTNHKNDRVYLELKLDNDQLHNSQLDWIFQHATKGKTVYVMMVQTPEHTVK